jgi:plasmid replication initiation protein
MKYLAIAAFALLCVAGGRAERGCWALGAEIFAPAMALLAWASGREGGDGNDQK